MFNQFKTVILLAALSGLLLLIGNILGGAAGLTVALIIAVIMNVGSYLFSHKIVLAMYRAKEAPKSQYPKLHEIVEEVAKEAKVPKPKIYIIPSENPNAFCTGPNPKKAVLGYTQGILKLLSNEELKGVTAHEIAHDKNRDMLISTIAATIATVITYVAHMAQFAALFGGSGRDDNERGGNIIGLLFLAILAPIAAMLIQLAISRSREYIADETGAKLIKNGEPLARALEKLENYGKNNPMLLGNNPTNNLFIVNPFRGAGRAFGGLFMTHPPISERVKKLKELKI
ncbi:zinc metalloprotease HtpX [Candidatus Woesearchaeota archaeon]|nr:zinc metalloprotease HtpX [Candidatus Woesearchaeota archaeon]